MVDSADEPPLSTRLHSWDKNTTLSPVSLNSLRASRDNQDPVLPATRPQPEVDFLRRKDAGNNPSAAGPAPSDQPIHEKDNKHQDVPSVDQEGDGAQSSTIGSTESEAKQSLGSRIVRDVKRIIFSSWINWLLLIVPVALILGALVDWGHTDVVDPTVVFALNAVAIIPLASLLSFATESVAIRMGDTIGALLNVTFGNAEKEQIREYVRNCETPRKGKKNKGLPPGLAKKSRAAANFRPDGKKNVCAAKFFPNQSSKSRIHCRTN